MSHLDIRRVVVAILDGLRPDAIEAFGLSAMQRLVAHGASTLRARTVVPSQTWPALTSLTCGVPPDVHGILSDSLHVPRPRSPLAPLPELLCHAGYSSAAFMGAVPLLYRGVASRIARGLGFAEARFAGTNAMEVLRSGRQRLQSQRRGLILFHFADADRAGHAQGWMSPAYGESARAIDAALGALADDLAIEHDPHTLLIALADHGGGGVSRRDHQEDHPLNVTIPLSIAGGSVRRIGLADATLLDVPATIAWVLGVPAPRAWTGRVLLEAFPAAHERAVA